MLHPDDLEDTLFDERAAFLSQTGLRSEHGLCQIYATTTGAIGGHAIARLLERNLATSETLPATVTAILNVASNLQHILHTSGLDADRSWSLLVPIEGGAAAAVTQRVKPRPGENPGMVVRVASVRTVLRDDMLSPDQRRRMATEDLVAAGQDMPALEAWLRRNARPWVAPRPASENSTETSPEPIPEPVVEIDDLSPV